MFYKNSWKLKKIKHQNADFRSLIVTSVKNLSNKTKLTDLSFRSERSNDLKTSKLASYMKRGKRAIGESQRCLGNS